MYDRYFLRYQRYKAYLEQLKERRGAKRQGRIEEGAGAETGDSLANSRSAKTYEEKYPRESEDSRCEGPLTTAQAFEQFQRQDVNGLRSTLNKTIQGFNQSTTLTAQTNMELFDIGARFGRRTFYKNLYFITFLAAFFYCTWSCMMIWGARNTVQSHAYTLCNLHGVLLIPLMMLSGRPTHQLEKVGFVIVVIACIALLLDQSSYRADSTMTFKQ